MKLTFLRGGGRGTNGGAEVPVDCNVARKCPNVNLTDRGTLVIQGYIVEDEEILSELTIPPGESVVEIPLALIPELAGEVEQNV